MEFDAVPINDIGNLFVPKYDYNVDILVKALFKLVLFNEASVILPLVKYPYNVVILLLAVPKFVIVA